jgi:hypothetical protein
MFKGCCRRWCCKRGVAEDDVANVVLKQCYRSGVAEDNVANAMLKWCCRRRCCKGGAEVMLQKMVLQKWCWSGAAEDVKMVFQKLFLQRITSASVASKCTSTFFLSLSFFHSCPLVKKMIMNVALVFIFCSSYDIRAKDDNECNVRCHLLLFLQN